MQLGMQPGTAACVVDPSALERARAERVDWRFKAIPSAMHGLTIAAAAARRPDLFTDGFLGPFVVLEADALDHNLRAMADWCAAHGMLLAPHGKTTMAPQLFAKQAEHGAWAITAANASQLRVYRAFGVSRIVFANQLVDPAAIRWLADELAADLAFEFCCWVDSVRGARLLADTLREHGAHRQVDVLVEVEGGRTGVQDESTALDVARAVRDSPELRLLGVSGYEGSLGHDATEHTRSLVADYLERLRSTTTTLASHGLFDHLDQVLVTAGGSAYFDQVADALATGWPAGLAVRPVLRSGGYLSHDDGFYRATSPLGATPRLTDAAPFRSALRAWAQVSSLPTADRAVLTMGKRDASFDDGLPEPQWRRGASGLTPLTGHMVRAMNDQHTHLELPADSPIEVGDWVGFGLSHPCTVFDKWPLIPLVDGDTVVDFIRTYF
ncbi:D-serine deaminase-like pyridoxal phosphate-dependent protein [Tamaricihabitans halophyticus]|uniref:D-serine deaminase-like pyridoxal phosphate-dependent protein n=1 Tax=Tamaricihabitans halophyticus TaxID=1262583 RepID=A0A4R2Q7L4_9PSEU|nr:amino acid deaminase [Tamaricihabitans halophyticus]TCP44750.1 D-serine deaminase-like pyridoxal phosphate-dependent protein [Tamaricihabitans halophyticus]